MRVPIGWLSEFVESPPQVDELARVLTMAGLEVEEIHAADSRLVEGLVVAKIVEMQRHPNADRLSLCQVDDGTSRRPIVCGASNMSAGDCVVLATPGTVLPGGMKIKKSKIRGELSEGMLCAASELGIEDDADGIMILDADARPGARAAAILGLDETVLEIGITPNRGDALSIVGVAREVATLCDLEFRPPADAAAAGGASSASSKFSVAIDTPELCPLYHGIEIHGVTVQQSPAWMKARLSAAGLRPINNVVDVTNYVLWELGQPLHAFDADKLAGQTVSVRTIDKATEIETLDDQQRALIQGDLAIWDADGPVAVAGVMGGVRTAVDENTKSIFLEAAVFSPQSVRATSRRLGLVSDSSYRFERGIDTGAVAQALVRAAHLIAETSGGSVACAPVTAGPGVAAASGIVLRGARINAVLGIDVDCDETERSLVSLGARVERNGDEFTVYPPSHRHDLTREIDLIEEVLRVRGYDTVPEQVPAVPMLEACTPSVYDFSAKARERLVALGLNEIVGLAFCSHDLNRIFAGLHAATGAVVVRNPLRADATEMRRSLLPGLIETHAFNRRNGAEVSDLFSMGRTFSQADAPLEIDSVAVLLFGPRTRRAPGRQGEVAYWDARSVFEQILASLGATAVPTWTRNESRCDLHPRAAATASLGGEDVGVCGMIHPDAADAADVGHDIALLEIDMGKAVANVPPRSALRAIPKFPASSRDVSLLVPDEIPAGRIIDEILSLDEPLIERVFVFDQYVGEGIAAGHRALAFSVVYRSVDETLTDEAVSTLHDRAIKYVTKTLGIRVRG